MTDQARHKPHQPVHRLRRCRPAERDLRAVPLPGHPVPVLGLLYDDPRVRHVVFASGSPDAVMSRLRNWQVATDVELLRDHISDAERKEWTIPQVVEFLLESGFKRYGENWIAEEDSLAVLAKGEYKVVRWL